MNFYRAGTDTELSPCFLVGRTIGYQRQHIPLAPPPAVEPAKVEDTADEDEDLDL